MGELAVSNLKQLSPQTDPPSADTKVESVFPQARSRDGKIMAALEPIEQDRVSSLAAGTYQARIGRYVRNLQTLLGGIRHDSAVRLHVEELRTNTGRRSIGFMEHRQHTSIAQFDEHGVPGTGRNPRSGRPGFPVVDTGVDENT